MNLPARIGILLGFCFVGAVGQEKPEAPLFPPDTFSDFTVQWYSKHFKAMKEEALPPVAEDPKAVVYRFTCLRTFHRPFSIRITKNPTGYTLHRKVLSGKGGYDPGELEASVESKLTAADLGELKGLLRKVKFSELDAFSADGGLDGSQWIFEAVTGGNYKIIDRWTPDEGSAMRKIGEWFLKKAEWKPDKLY